MRVRELIDYLLDQPMNNTVYVAGVDPATGGQSWNGEVIEITGDKAGVMATYITFNETGLYAHIDTELGV